MSGIEILGLLLGGIPVLLEGLDIYKAGLGKVKAGFRKRKHVEKLSHALLLQRQTLEAVINSVLLSSGCEAPFGSKDDKQAFLRDPKVQNDVAEYLGEKNDSVFKYAVQECDAIVQQLAIKIAALVPSTSTDLLKIIEGNKDAKKGQVDLLARISLAFKFKDIKEGVEKLDASVASLDRFLRLISSNRQLNDDQPSRKATKLAKAFWKIRKHADDLYLAVSQGWLPDCHKMHEAKLFLNDRIDQVLGLAKNKGKNDDLPIFDFRLIFAGDVNQRKCLWHETIVEIFEEGDPSTPSPESHHVKFITPPNQCRNRSTLKAIKDICSAIENAECDKKHLIFVLTESRRIAMALPPEKPFVPCQLKQTVTLKDILLDNNRQRIRNPILPWKFRMVLALKLASSFLQLLQTRWTEPTFSSDAVQFLLQPTEQKADVSRPFLSLSFESSSSSQAPSQANAKVGEVLLELGIMLLEIWHETTLEERFSLQAQPMSHRVRQSWALEWLDDADNPLPELYYKAVNHCVARVMDGGSRLPKWDDMKLWKAVCEGVIEPLSKISKI